MEEQTEKRQCPYCNSDKTKKFGFRPRVKGRIRLYQCNDCGHVFTDETKPKMTVTNQQGDVNAQGR